MKKISITFVVVVLVIAGFVTLQAGCSKNPDLLSIGSFLMLTFTLIVLVWYAYDTNSIARITQQRWLREGVLSTTYNLMLKDNKGEQGLTFFELQNPSTLIVRARINFNFQVYGQLVSAGGLYNGNEVWLVFPQQISRGWFEIESLLQQKGKTVAAMIKEYTPENQMEQLSAVLEIEFWDELDQRRKLPERLHYFDFNRWTWIPQLAEGAEL
jgi:hypothetical protein